MSRLAYIEPEEANALTRKLFRKVGMVPNLYTQMANSTMVLDGFLKLNACLDGSKLDKKFREMIYLAVSELNGCEYCLASHTATAVENGVLTQEETLMARRRRAADPRAQALLAFTEETVEGRGKVRNETLEEVRNQGFDDEEILDALGTIGLATLSNYVAIVGQTELDFLDAPELG